MRRADRLFQIIQILRRRKVITARDLAERLEVSQRTIYRDMQDLSLSGVPVEGEVGTGYYLRYSLDIPPLMFTEDEIEALVVGARLVKAWAGQTLAMSAQSVIDKVVTVIPKELQHNIEQSKLFTQRSAGRTDIDLTLDFCRIAIDERHFLNIKYKDDGKKLSERKIKPLALVFRGNVWTLTAWCELRNNFRSFRLDRIKTIEKLDEQFETLTHQSLDEYYAQMYHRYDKTG